MPPKIDSYEEFDRQWNIKKQRIQKMRENLEKEEAKTRDWMCNVVIDLTHRKIYRHPITPLKCAVPEEE